MVKFLNRALSGCGNMPKRHYQRKAICKEGTLEHALQIEFDIILYCIPYQDGAIICLLSNLLTKVLFMLPAEWQSQDPYL